MRTMKIIRAICGVVLFSFVSLAVAGATSTTTTTTVKDETVTTVTTVTDKEGNIISTDDPTAREKADAAKKERQDRLAALADAPKRGPYDPIQVALFETVMSEDLRK